jgi:hypothetical protein
VLRRFAIDQLAFPVIRSNPHHRAHNESIPQFKPPLSKTHASNSPGDIQDVTSIWLSILDDRSPGAYQQ